MNALGRRKVDSHLHGLEKEKAFGDDGLGYVFSSLRDVCTAGILLPATPVGGMPSSAESDRKTLDSSRNERSRLTDCRSARGKVRPVGLVSHAGGGRTPPRPLRHRISGF